MPTINDLRTLLKTAGKNDFQAYVRISYSTNPKLVSACELELFSDTLLKNTAKRCFGSLSVDLKVKSYGKGETALSDSRYNQGFLTIEAHIIESVAASLKPSDEFYLHLRHANDCAAFEEARLTRSELFLATKDNKKKFLLGSFIQHYDYQPIRTGMF